MTEIDPIRPVDEEAASIAVDRCGYIFPIGDRPSLAQVIGMLLEDPVSVPEVEQALQDTFIKLPIRTSAQILEVFKQVSNDRYGGAAILA